MRAASVAGLAAATLLIAGCGSSSHGTVNVLYAGSLTNLMEGELGPAFARADHYVYQGVGAGSSELAVQIKSHVRQGDVFISASPDADRTLEGIGNGNHVRWYATFATSSLLVGFNPHSGFASQFRSKPWYRVITEPGIRVGRTDPKLDPKGKLTVKAIDEAATRLSDPGLRSALPRFPVFPEEDLVGRLEAGQLDAGFFYSVEASAQHIPTVSIAPITAAATYTVTIPAGARDIAGARAFVAFLLGPAGRRMLSSHGLTLRSPSTTGPASAVPTSLRAVVGAG